jgi:hypothetical protein
MKFQKNVIDNYNYISRIKKVYNTNRLTWQIQKQNNNITSVCLDNTSRIRDVCYTDNDFKRIEVWGYGEEIPYTMIIYPPIDGGFDERCKSKFKFFTPQNVNYCTFFGSEYFIRETFLIKIYE